MAITLAVTDAYATVDETDAYLENDSTWNAITNEAKENALLWGKYYIDERYDCVDVLDAISDELRYSNSLLAADYAATPATFKPQVQVLVKTVQAGSVKTHKEFAATNKIVPSNSIKVKTILSKICSRYCVHMYTR